MKKVNLPVDLTVTAKTWLDTHLVHAYLVNKYKSRDNVLVIPMTNPKSLKDFYLETYAEIGQARRDNLSDIIIPFHMEPFKHYTLVHVKFVGPSKQPVIYWLDSLGSRMPAAVKATLNEVFQQADKVIHEQPIQSQQHDAYNCGAYVAVNAEAMVRNIDQFKPLTDSQAVALRKEMVTVANESLEEKYVYIDAPANAPKAPVTTEAATQPEDWNKEKFEDTISQDLLKFGESIQDSENAFDQFDCAFNIAAAAFQNAQNSLTSNRYAFFNEYQDLKAQMPQYQATKTEVTKPCTTEAEPVLEEGRDFTRVVATK